MKITGLKVTNLRALKLAEFSFQPGMNLLVGVNGVGKTTVLEALRICLSRTIPDFSYASKILASSFGLDDIQIDSQSMTTEMEFEILGTKQHYLIHKQKEEYVPEKEGSVRLQAYITPDHEKLTPGSNEQLLKQLNKDDAGPFKQPIAIYFSTRRSLASYATPSKSRSKGGVMAAFGDALINSRELRLSEIASWMHAQAALAGERPLSDRHLDALLEAASRFLPECENLHTKMDMKLRLLVDKGGKILDVMQLSDGERGMLALVLDLAQRLSLANSGLENPIQDGEAVVLIDELDLHLHPKWQRAIVRRLTETFPNCQFIATTHSPLIIGEVSHDRIQIIADGQVYSPTHSFGVDSSRVLEEVMDTNPRTDVTAQLLSQISREIGQNQFDVARKSLSALIEHLGENDPEITRMRTLLDFMEGEE
ncbi:MAG: AAA family ATPase [Magnetococcales bacterium]|nr:AAA family ATPase [Magnetococcales bacterium]